MFHSLRKKQSFAFILIGLVLIVILLAGCGGGSGASSNNGSVSIPAAMPAQHSAQSATGSSNTNTSSSPASQQYLIKSLNISMEVNDTQKVAMDLQNWITTTDTEAVANNINYEQTGDNLYNVSMTFSVQASLFPRIESYLDSYPALNHGHLLNTTLNTQDVSNDYIDTQSRLINLKGEQQRLLTLMSNAQSLGDILTIDQRLTDVEGQIEQIEAHLNDLKGQTTFYTVAISLQPIGTAAPVKQPAAWSPLAVWQGAASAFVAVGQVLLTMFIWLLMFSVYIIPFVIIAWLVRRWRHIRALRAAPKVAATSIPPQTVS
ncbi:MAG: DUF4349 domain-containing protein [Ktedonobacteraceae bacterium]